MLVELALARAEGNMSAAAKLLGMTRRQFAYRIEKAGTPLDEAGGAAL